MNNEKKKCMTHRLVIVMKSINYSRHYFLSNEHTHKYIFRPVSFGKWTNRRLQLQCSTLEVMPLIQLNSQTMISNRLVHKYWKRNSKLVSNLAKKRSPKSRKLKKFSISQQITVIKWKKKKREIGMKVAQYDCFFAKIEWNAVIWK